MPPKFYKKYPKKTFTKSKPVSTEADNARLGRALYLIIVESPSKCKKIEEYLGPDYYCIASKGHIRRVDGLKAVDTRKTFEPVFTIIEEKAAHVEKMRSTIAAFDIQNIYLAADDDREGEAIAWHICDIFGLPTATTKRILFHEITSPAIVAAVASPTVLNMSLVNAQKARQVLDIIMGYKVSPYLWKMIQNNQSNALSAGRCQTPALRLVYDNYLEKAKSAMEIKHKIVGIFTSKHIKFDLNTEFQTDSEVLSFMNKTMQGHKHMLSIGSQTDTKKSAPVPFNTSRLLQVASNVLHMSPAETMNVCQLLYQGGWITYMRTESSQYSKEFLEKMRAFVLGEFGGAEYLGDFDVLENKDKSKPHEAIRVTHLNTRSLTKGSITDGEGEGNNPRMVSMYNLIWRNTVESCMASAKYKNTTIKISAPTGVGCGVASKDTYYSHVVEIPVFLGWKVVSENRKTSNGGGGSGLEGEQGIQNGLLLFFKSLTSAPVPYVSIESQMIARNKHSHYTEASLIHKLEEIGIGRPSTFSSIVETIQERGYVKKRDVEGKVFQCVEYKLEGGGGGTIQETKVERLFNAEHGKLCIEPMGVLVLDFLLTYYEPLFSYDYTKSMETELDLIASTTCDTKWSDICKACFNDIKDLSKPIDNLLKGIYKIDDSHDFVYTKYGPSIRTGGEYLPVKKSIEIDVEKLKSGGYTLDDLLEVTSRSLGEYEGEPVYIKSGRYGNYVEYGDIKKSIKNVDKDIQNILLEDILSFIEVETVPDKKRGILRILNTCLSVRNGKYGAYLYYKRADMKTPQFLNMKKFPDQFMTCPVATLVDWACATYKLGAASTP